MNEYNKCDKCISCCATCMFWQGWRTFDGLGTFTYDMRKDMGKCGQVAWKGFSGSDVGATFQCPDYEPLHK